MAKTSAAKSGGGRARRGGSRGVHLMLFFTFVFAYLAIFILMQCTLVATLVGFGLLLVSLTILVSGYLAGA